MEPRPRILPQKLKLDKLLEISTVVLLFISIIVAVYFYFHLPETIPIHYSASGAPDNYGPRISIFFLPAMSLILFSGIYTLNKYPQLFNYLHPITEENAARQYANACRLLRVVNFFMVALLFTCLVLSINSSMEQNSPLPGWLLPLIFLFSFSLVAYTLYQSIRK